MKEIYDTVIIGGGPGGFTAALYAARAGLKTLLLEKLSPGGQMALTHKIDNYPGFPDGADGFALGEDMRRQAERFGAQTRFTEVQAVDLTAQPKKIISDQGEYLAKTVILAMGAGPRELGLPGEKELVGRGVAYCAACDGMFYRGKTVAVVGGGNSAAADALLLSRIAEKVLLIHRRDTLRAAKIYRKQLENAKNVQTIWNSEVTGLLQAEKFTGLRLKNTLTGEETALSCDGVFISIGRKPASGLVWGQLTLDDAGYIVAGESTETPIPGVFAAGDVRAKALRQIVTAVSDGAAAAHQAERYLSEMTADNA